MQFEDLVYHYDGTKRYLNNEKYQKDIEYIEKELQEYLYTAYDLEVSI